MPSVPGSKDGVEMKQNHAVTHGNREGEIARVMENPDDADEYLTIIIGDTNGDRVEMIEGDHLDPIPHHCSCPEANIFAEYFNWHSQYRLWHAHGPNKRRGRVATVKVESKFGDGHFCPTIDKRAQEFGFSLAEEQKDGSVRVYKRLDE